MKDLRNYPLLAHNTFGMDVRASRFAGWTMEYLGMSAHDKRQYSGAEKEKK